MIGALIAVACTAGDDGSPDPTGGPALSSPPAVEAPPAPPPSSASSLPGRLLVKQTDGSLVTVRPDGSDLQVLAKGAGQDLQVLQAAWAPDGSRVAWVQVDTADGPAEARIVTADPDGGNRRETTMPIVPFYLSWDPTSARVGYLGSDGGDRLEMGVVESGGRADPPTTLGRGSPFYFAWAPEGDRVLVHVGRGRLDELGIDGSSASLGASPGMFQAPVWSSDGTAQIYVEGQGGGERQRIVVRDAQSGSSRTLASADGAVSLVLSPDGEQVAFQGLNREEANLFDRTLPQRATDVGVTVLDVDTGRAERVTVQPAVAFFWGPSGDRLLILEPIYRIAGPMYFRWVVWDGKDSIVTSAFTPGISLLTEYTPFFSQYAQSLTMWAPDGSAFAYPADRPPAPSTIFVQPVTSGQEPYALGTGSFVAWSPDPGR